MLSNEELELDKIFASHTPMVKINAAWGKTPKPMMSEEDKKALRSKGTFSIDGLFTDPASLTKAVQADIARQVPASAPAVTKLVSVEDYRRVANWLKSMVGTDPVTLSTRDKRIKDLQLGVDFHPSMSSDDEVVSHSILYEEAARTLHNIINCDIAKLVLTHEETAVDTSVSNWLTFVSSKLTIRLSYLLNRSKRRTTYISIKECLYNLHLRGTGYFDDRVFDIENLSELSQNLKEIREASPESAVDIMAVNVCVWKLSDEQEDLSTKPGYEALIEFNKKVEDELMYFLNNFSSNVASHHDDEIVFGTGFGDKVRDRVKENSGRMESTIKLTKEQVAEADRYDAEQRVANLPNLEEALRIKTELRVLEQQKYFHALPQQVQLAVRDRVLKDHELDLLDSRTVIRSTSTLIRTIRDADSGSLFLGYIDWGKVPDVYVAALLRAAPVSLGLFEPDAEVLDRIYNAYPSVYPILKGSRKSREHYLRYIHYARTHAKSDNFVSKLLNTFSPPDIGLPTLQMPMTLDIVLAITHNVPSELEEWFVNEAPGFSDNKEFSTEIINNICLKCSITSKSPRELLRVFDLIIYLKNRGVVAPDQGGVFLGASSKELSYEDWSRLATSLETYSWALSSLLGIDSAPGVSWSYTEHLPEALAMMTEEQLESLAERKVIDIYSHFKDDPRIVMSLSIGSTRMSFNKLILFLEGMLTHAAKEDLGSFVFPSTLLRKLDIEQSVVVDWLKNPVSPYTMGESLSRMLTRFKELFTNALAQMKKLKSPAVGIQGMTGVGVMGTTGIRGITGVMGITGNQGYVGGNYGLTGMVGSCSSEGATGSSGYLPTIQPKRPMMGTGHYGPGQLTS